MTYKQFWPGDKVITTINYAGIPSGVVATVIKRWVGTGYIVRALDGEFYWLDSSEFGSDDPERDFILREGDVGVVTSGHHNHPYAKVGDRFLVYKVVKDADHYEVLINNEKRYLIGIMIAPYM